MTGSDVLACYDELAVTVADMLELARTRQWARLPELDARCSELVARIEDAPSADFSESEHIHLETLASRIQQGQDALNALVQPQLLHLVRRMYEVHGGR